MNVRHILGIAGGKDSAALSIYLKQKYPELKIEYYNSDTGCELAETELLIDRLEAYLGKIVRLRAAKDSPEPTPFENNRVIKQKYNVYYIMNSDGNKVEDHREKDGA